MIKWRSHSREATLQLRPDATDLDTLDKWLRCTYRLKRSCSRISTLLIAGWWKIWIIWLFSSLCCHLVDWFLFLCDRLFTGIYWIVICFDGWFVYSVVILVVERRWSSWVLKGDAEQGSEQVSTEVCAKNGLKHEAGLGLEMSQLSNSFEDLGILKRAVIVRKGKRKARDWIYITVLVRHRWKSVAKMIQYWFAQPCCEGMIQPLSIPIWWFSYWWPSHCQHCDNKVQSSISSAIQIHPLYSHCVHDRVGWMVNLWTIQCSFSNAMRLVAARAKAPMHVHQCLSQHFTQHHVTSEMSQDICLDLISAELSVNFHSTVHSARPRGN